MNNTFIYEQGWLVEKPDEHSENRKYVINNDEFIKSYEIFDKHLATLRRFKWNYPDPKREMELGKDFEVKTEWRLTGEIDNGAIVKREVTVGIPIPITQRTYSEQEDKPLKQEGTKLLVVRIDGYLAFNTYVRESEFELMKGRLASVLGRPVPPEYKTFSEQDLLDTWKAAKEREFFNISGLKLGRKCLSKEDFFKQKFGIEIK